MIRLPSWQQSINETTLYKTNAMRKFIRTRKININQILDSECFVTLALASGGVNGPDIRRFNSLQIRIGIMVIDIVYFQQIFPFIRPIENFDASECFKQITTVCLRSTHWTAVYHSSVNCNILHWYTRHFHHAHTHTEREIEQCIQCTHQTITSPKSQFSTFNCSIWIFISTFIRYYGYCYWCCLTILLALSSNRYCHCYCCYCCVFLIITFSLAFSVTM